MPRRSRADTKRVHHTDATAEEWAYFELLSDKIDRREMTVRDVAERLGRIARTITSWRKRLREIRSEMLPENVTERATVDEGFAERLREMVAHSPGGSAAFDGRGMEFRAGKNGVPVVWLHYEADERKRTETWREIASQGMSPRDWSRNYEIDYTVAVGEPVYDGFSDANIVEGFHPRPDAVILRGWDFGFRRPALVWSTVQDGRWYLLGAFMGDHITIKEFALEVIRESQSYFQGRRFKDYCDAAGMQTDAGTGLTSIDVLRQFGIRPKYRKLAISYGIEIVHQKIRSRGDDGVPELVVAQNGPGAQMLIDTLRSGYHFTEIRDGNAIREEPKKDGWWEHPADCVRYIAHSAFRLRPLVTKPQTERQKYAAIRRQRREKEKLANQTGRYFRQWSDKRCGRRAAITAVNPSW